MASAAELDAEQLCVANLNTVEFDLDLPTRGPNGSSISWSSDNERFVRPDGTVTQPRYGMGPRDVRLTATFSCPEGTVTRTYPVHVLEAKNDIVVEHVREARVRAELGRPCWLPAVVIVGTADGRLVSHPVEWDGGIEQTFAELGERHAAGHVAGTTYPAEATVEVVARLEPELAPTGCAVDSFDPGAARLDAGSELFDQQQRSLAFLRSVDDDQMLYNFRATAGLDTLGAPQMVGWDAPECLLRGHTTGHYLSALEVAEGMGAWAHERLSRLSHEELTTMWGIYIAGEFGGMNDALARLYERTGRHEFIDAARLFDNDKLFVPMEQGVDTLEDVHANQHIPQVIGALRLFEDTGERRYLDIARNFWDIVVGAHVYAIGGTGESEMWHHPNRVARQLSEHTAESCCSYNMVKLTRGLYRHERRPEMLDYYERTMLNHVLASGDKHARGARTYFMPLAPGFHKEFDDENSCCHGTGLEDDFMYADGIYYHTDDELEVALFVPSHVDWEERGVAVWQRVEQDRRGFRVVVSFAGTDSRFRLRVRRPLWADPEGLLLDGEPAKVATTRDGRWLELERTWHDGDSLEFRLPCSPRLEAAPDDPDKVVVCWGPYVLAFLTPSSDFLRLGTDERPLDEVLVQDGDGPSFVVAGTGTRVRPLCMLEGEDYQVYVRR